MPPRITTVDRVKVSRASGERCCRAGGSLGNIAKPEIVGTLFLKNGKTDILDTCIPQEWLAISLAHRRGSLIAGERWSILPRMSAASSVALCTSEAPTPDPRH
jgi:hypothetical protein